MKVIIVSSPTGGHLYPAIYLSKKLLENDFNVLFVTQDTSNFIDLVKRSLPKNIDIKKIKAPKFSRKNFLHIFYFIYLLIIAFIQSLKILIKSRPNLIVSTGGYTSFPIIFCARILFFQCKIILHEQNYILGLANKILSILSDKVCLGFDSNVKNSKKYYFTGNPIREEFFAKYDRNILLDKYGLEKEKFTVLIFGGSQGSSRINETFLKILQKNLSELGNIQIFHITGQRNYQIVKEKYNKLNIKSVVLPYLFEMAEAYNISDIIVSRAGAMTVSEIIFFRKPAVLIPYPFASEWHQNFNAEYLRKLRCAEVVYENEKFERKLEQTLLYLVKNKNILYNYKNNFEKIPVADKSILDVISETIQSKISYK